MFWSIAFVMAFALPAYAVDYALPSVGMVNSTIVASCPAVDSEKCMAAADLLQAVGSFYETIIIILIALLAAVVSLVYLSIRAASRHQIEEQFEKDLRSEWFKDRIQRQIEGATEKAISDLARRIEILDSAIASMRRDDFNEDKIAETTIITNGGD
jgi:hypothetical protein